MSLASLMNIKAQVLVLTQPTTATLGAQRIWVPTGATVFARVEMLDEKAKEIWQQQNIVATHRWSFNKAANLKDLINALLYNGDRYEIKLYDNFQNMNRLWIAITEKIRSQPG